MPARAARSGTHGLLPLGLGGSGGSKGSMIIHSSSGTNCFTNKQDPTESAPDRFAGHIKPRRLVAVPGLRPTAALGSSCPTGPGTPRSCRRRSGRRRYLAPQHACQWEGCPAVHLGACPDRSTARPPCPLPRSAPQRWNASRGMFRETYQRNSLTHQDRPPLLWACGSRRRSPLTRPQQSCSPRSRTPPRSGAPVPYSLPPTSRYLLCVRLNLVTWTVRQTMRESNPTFVGVFGTVCGLTTQVAENRELLGGWGVTPALFVCLPVL